MSTITNKSTVTMNFTIRLKDGSIADSSKNYEQSLRFTMGDGTFSPVFEEAIIGLKKGDHKKVLLQAKDAFGERNEANVYQVPLKRFSDMNQEDLVPGAIIEFTQANGQTLPGIIGAVNEHEASVDFNHPLAGEVLLFEVDVLELDS